VVVKPDKVIHQLRESSKPVRMGNCLESSRKRQIASNPWKDEAVPSDGNSGWTITGTNFARRHPTAGNPPGQPHSANVYLLSGRQRLPFGGGLDVRFHGMLRVSPSLASFHAVALPDSLSPLSNGGAVDIIKKIVCSLAGRRDAPREELCHG
jgi:hypothetical protein